MGYNLNWWCLDFEQSSDAVIGVVELEDSLDVTAELLPVMAGLDTFGRDFQGACQNEADCKFPCTKPS